MSYEEQMLRFHLLPNYQRVKESQAQFLLHHPQFKTDPARIYFAKEQDLGCSLELLIDANRGR